MKNLKLTIPFDQFGRYYFISKIVEENRVSGKPLKILDVGGYNGRVRDFLPKDNVTILDVFDVVEDGYVKGSGLDIQFPDKSFDVVTTADTLEHIPKDKRDLFLSECYRVSKDFLIVAAPFETGKTAEAEDYVNDVYKILSGHSYEWLKEHKEYGLPDPKSILNWAERNNLRHFVLNNNNIEEWKELISQFFVLDNLPSMKGNKFFLKESEDYNLTSNQFQAEEPAYRQVYVFSKNNIKSPQLPKKSFPKNISGLERLLKTIKFYLDEQKEMNINDFLFKKVTSQLNVYQDIKPQKNDNELMERLVRAESELNAIKSSTNWLLINKLNSVVGLRFVSRIFTKTLRLIFKIYKYRIYASPDKLFWRLSTKTPPYVKEDLAKLRFKKESKPQVSIIIPIYGKATMTLDCLKSLHNHKTKYSFEVVLIDDSSPDKSKKLFNNIPGIVFYSNPINRGFIYSCNKGSELAKGDSLVFLNNDTLVLEGWLDALIDRLSSDSNIGLVGSKLIYPNGVLQEAGGIIFSDASGWNYGKGDDPTNFEYNYLREVDYCSGASIAIKSSLFRQLGRFDTRYSPAYYEDTDLAFSVRQAGLKVIYEPLSSIIHREGASSGTDISTGTKRYQVINQQKFADKWKNVLSSNHYESSNYLFYAKDRSSDKNVLIIDHYVPEYDKDSGSVRMTELIKVMKDLGYRITLWPQNLYESQPYTTYFQSLGVQVIYGHVDFVEYSKKFGDYYDLVILSRPSVAPNFIDHVNSYYRRAKVIYDTVDLSFLRIRRLSEIDNNPDFMFESEQWKKLELGLMQRTDATLVVSEAEKKILNKESPFTKVEIVSNIHNLKPLPNLDLTKRSGLLFIGGFNHLPNVDAMIWFCEKIFPLVLKKYPQLKLSIVGSNPPQSIINLSSKNIKVLGYVENVDPLFNKSRVFIAPLRYGAGVKGKIGQASEYGLPVVSTTIGIEGMHMNNLTDCLIGDSEKTFANSIIKLVDNDILWRKLSKNSRDNISKHFSPENAKKSLESLIKNL